MYHPHVTARVVEETSRAQGWDLVYSSPTKIASAIAHFEELLDDETGRLKRPLTPEERAFIQNERKLCALDFLYWASNYAKIVDWSKKTVPFIPNIAQAIIIDIWAEHEERGLAIMLQQLKARQLGVTTLNQMAVTHRFQFWPFTNAIVASADPKKTVEMGQMIKFCLDSQPWWMLPVSADHNVDKQEKGMIVEFGDLNTRLSIQAGNQFHGVARGATPNVGQLCLAPQTLVRVANGMLKPIREVTPEDSILTHDGHRAQVRACWLSSRRNELGLDLWVWGTFAPLSVTRDHKIWTPQGWVPAHDLRSGDWVRQPVRPITHSRKEFSVIKRSTGQPLQQKATKLTHPLSRDWGYLFGFYLAEGSIQGQMRKDKPTGRPSQLCFSIDVSEVDDRMVRLKTALGEMKIGVRRHNSRTRVLAVSYSGLARWIIQEWGQKDEKRVPDWVWEGGRDFCLGIVEGYLEGDGHFEPHVNDIAASSVRVQLPIQIRDLIASLGFGWCGIHYKQAGVYFERNCRAQWTLIASGQTAKALREGLDKPSFPCSDRRHWFYAPKQASMDVQIDRVADSYSSTFYDLEVDHADHSFTTVQCSVHNSEVSSWENAEDDIDASFIRAIHETPDVFVSLESTALGRDNWWARSWELVKEEWPRGRSRLRGIFLPWFVGTDIYPTATDLRTRPVPANWIPMDRTIHHAERARAYVKSNPALFQYLAKGNADWRMPRTQMWYYEIEREMAIRKKTLNKFLAEMTSDDQECVIGSTRISTPHGIIPIAEASKSTSTETGRVTKWWDRGLRDVMAVTTKFGREVAGTPDHRLALVDGSWRSIAALRVGDRLKLSPPIFSESKYVARWKWSPTCEMALPIDKDLAKLIGVFVGDGCWGSNSIEIACFIQDTDTIAEIERIITAIIGRPPTHSTRGGLYLIRSSSIKWWQLWWNLGLLDRRYHKRQDRHSGYIKRLRVPECIWRSPKPVVAAFLSGLFETDGHASRFAPQTSFFTKSPDLMRDVQLLLLGFGINAEHRHSEKRKGPYVFTGRVLRLNALNTVRFHEQIGFMGQRKRSAVKTVKTGRGRRPNPIVMEDTVQSVEARDRQPVYDISIAETHAFGGNGILCHNSFQNTGLSVIDQDVILSYREKVRPPLGVYAIIGPGIHPSLVPPRHLWLTGPNDPAVITVHASKACRSTEIFQFVPLKFEGYPGYDPMGKLFIYEWPADGETYGTGCDTADGIGQDWSVIEGFRKGNATACHAQTCEYASPYIKADQLWPMMLAISCFYSTTHRADGRPMQCRAAIECRGNGEIVQSEMQKRGWWNFHPWKKYDNKRPIPDANVHKLGVFTNVWFRSMMLDKLLTCIDEEALEVGSPWFVNEMASLERDPDENSARAAYDTHDDRVMALGFALFSLTVEDRPSKTFRRSTPQYLPESTDADPVLVGAYPTWSPGLQANSELGNRLAYPVDRSRVGMPTLGTPRRPTGKGW